jgi:hypothetical protein
LVESTGGVSGALCFNLSLVHETTRTTERINSKHE